MALLDDLKGILTPEEFAKIEANTTLTAGFTERENLLKWYRGDTTEEPVISATPATQTTVATPPATSQFDLSRFESMFDTRIAKMTEAVDAKINDVVKARGDELVGNAVKIAVQRADELNRIYHRHAELTGKPFDSADFNTFLEKPEIKAKGYRTMNDAYEAYAAPIVQEKTVEAEVTKRVAATSGAHVPGSTPAPATNSNIRHFQARGRATDGTGQTRVQLAAAELDRKVAARQAQAS